MGGQENILGEPHGGTASTVKFVAELIAHATRLCAQKLRVQCLQSLQIGIQSRKWTTRRLECGVDQ